MRHQLLSSALVLASGLLGLVESKPHFQVSARDLYVAEACDDFVYGATKTQVGKVCASILEGTMTVTFEALTEGFTYSDLHVWVGTSAPTDGNPGRAPGGFPYTNGNGKCTIAAGGATGTCTFPVASSWRSCTEVLYIVTHATIANSSGSQTAWGAGTCWVTDKGNCPKYWTITRTCYCRSTSFPEPVTMTSTSTTTYTSTSTTEYLTSTTSTYVTSTTVEYSTTEYSTTTVTSMDTLTSTSTPEPITTTVTCVNPY
ncbi:hypothetical protein K458DRAFT_36727 [Lentithecium fluviatile CBS 122367]|uniref:Uncharacterized protein n=1 Tax=Lentithecium fluviatile CBS 122367 TaxID=1168545 RepID=A0A6G1J1H9_9PLEO|nr:hypothetical protein K458DRAFT_36727 [Lentithecium fluviatile CBS 122367]